MSILTTVVASTHWARLLDNLLLLVDWVYVGYEVRVIGGLYVMLVPFAHIP